MLSQHGQLVRSSHYVEWLVAGQASWTNCRLKWQGQSASAAGLSRRKGCDNRAEVGSFQARAADKGTVHVLDCENFDRIGGFD